jgi:hypothetical protein
MTAPSDERPSTAEGLPVDIDIVEAEAYKRGFDAASGPAVTEGLDVERLEVLRVAMERIEFLSGQPWDGDLGFVLNDIREVAHLALAEYARLSAKETE